MWLNIAVLLSEDSVFGFGFVRVFSGKMMMADAQTLLADYLSGSESAFRELVTRYVDLVFSTAFRLVDGDRPLAEDVTQTVFLDLARAARSLPRNTMLGGWLHRHTCFASAKARRGERRRLERERQAVEMSTLESDSGNHFAELAPMLDEAINQLGVEDRTAILLRFFERRDFRAVGQAVGTSEDGARMRVNRALAKLHELLGQKGVTLTVGALGAGLATQAVTAAPSGLAASVAATSLAGAGGGMTLTLLQLMTATKFKIALGVAALAGLAAPLVLQHEQINRLRAENSIWRQQVAKVGARPGQATEADALPTGALNEAASSNGSSSELLGLRGEVGMLRRQLDEQRRGVADLDRQLAMSRTNAEVKSAGNEIIASLKEVGWACTVYTFDHNDVCPTNFDQIRSILRPELRPGLHLERFEFVDHGGRPADAANPGAMLARERAPRQLPDGRWARVYLCVDGGAYQRITEDGDFDQFEKTWKETCDSQVEAAKEAAKQAAMRQAFGTNAPDSEAVKTAREAGKRAFYTRLLGTNPPGSLITESATDSLALHTRLLGTNEPEGDEVRAARQAGRQACLQQLFGTNAPDQ